MGIRSAIKQVFRLIVRICTLTFVATLPITFFPIIAGIEGAITFHFWNRAEIIRNVNSLEFESERLSHLSYFDVPGAQSIHDYMDQQGAFPNIPRLNSANWLQKLDLIPPNEHYDVSAGVDKMASFDGLVRDMSCASNVGKATRYWIFITELVPWMWSDWNEAFDEILRENYATPLPAKADIAYVDCADSPFLCGVWGVRAPTLLHITIEDESLLDREEREVQNSNDEAASWLEGLIQQNFTYMTEKEHLHPATVRVIELPLDNDQPLLPRNILPSPRSQLRALLHDPNPDNLLSHWEPHTADEQLLRRFNEYSTKLSENRGTWRYYVTEMDTWYSRSILTPILGKDFTGRTGTMADIQNITFTIAILLAEVVHFPCTVVWNVYAWYFGLGWDGEPIKNMSMDDEGSEGGDNMMEDMMQGFFKFVNMKMAEEASESAGKAAVTSSKEGFL